MTAETSANRMRSGAAAIGADKRLSPNFRELLSVWISDCAREIASGSVDGCDAWIAYDIANEYLREQRITDPSPASALGKSTAT